MARPLIGDVMRARESLEAEGIPGPYRMFVTSSAATELEREVSDGRRMFPQDAEWEPPPDIEIHGQLMTWRLSVAGVDVYCPKPPPISATCVEVDGARGVIAFAWNA